MSEHDERENYDDILEWGPPAPPHIVRLPAAIMWGVGLSQFLIVQMWLAILVGSLVFTHFVDDDKNLADAWDRVIRKPPLWGSFLGWPLATACTIIVMRGANDLKRFRRYHWVVVAATLTLLSVPIIFLGVVQVPLGIWLLWILLRRDVRARFEAVARGTKLAN